MLYEERFYNNKYTGNVSDESKKSDICAVLQFLLRLKDSGGTASQRVLGHTEDKLPRFQNRVGYLNIMTVSLFAFFTSYMYFINIIFKLAEYHKNHEVQEWPCWFIKGCITHKNSFGTCHTQGGRNLVLLYAVMIQSIQTDRFKQRLLWSGSALFVVF